MKKYTNEVLKALAQEDEAKGKTEEKARTATDMIRDMLDATVQQGNIADNVFLDAVAELKAKHTETVTTKTGKPRERLSEAGNRLLTSMRNKLKVASYDKDEEGGKHPRYGLNDGEYYTIETRKDVALAVKQEKPKDKPELVELAKAFTKDSANAELAQDMFDLISEMLATATGSEVVQEAA